MRKGINLKLLLMLPALLLFLIPLLGYQMLQGFAASIFETQRQSLTQLTEFVSKDIEDQHQMLVDLQAAEDSRLPLYVGGTINKPTLDGKFDDWPVSTPTSRLQTELLGKNSLLQINFPYTESSLTARLSLMADDSFLYIFVEVEDDSVVYREISNLSIHRNDHLRLSMIDKAGDFHRYTIATEQPGNVFARIVSTGGRSLRPEPTIHGNWRATDSGYNVELEVPANLVSNRFSINIADVDDLNSRDIKYIMGNAFTDDATELGYLIRPSKVILNYLARYRFAAFEFSDMQGHLIAQTTSELDSHSTEQTGNQRTRTNEFTTWVATLARYLPVNTKTAILEVEQVIGIKGRPIARLKATQTQSSSLRQIAHQSAWLLIISIIIIPLGIIISYLVVSVVIGRLRRLREELENAVDTQGRVQESTQLEYRQDEIGDLSRSFANISRRLHQYNDYLENMAGRLAHELKTPVSVVRSSLENLDALQLDEEPSRYVDRAHNGVQRLTSILNNMSEATRLEQSLDRDDVILFDLSSLLEGCVSGYENAFADHKFLLSIEASAVKVSGIPDLFAQLLDKLINNAVEFSPTNEPIKVRLTEEADQAVLRIANAGPNLPDAMQDKLFEPMISVRTETNRGHSHLGLGLYVAKIITEFHGGDIQVSNREDSQGVMITIHLPIFRLTSKLR